MRARYATIALAIAPAALAAQDNLLPTRSWGLGPVVSAWHFSTPVATSNGAIADVASTVRAELRAQTVTLRSAAGAVEVQQPPEAARWAGARSGGPVAGVLAEQPTHRPAAGPSDPDPQRRLVAMTPREGQILALMVDGLSNAEIGLVLHLSPETIKKDLGRIMDKLGVHNRVQATARVLREGLAH